LTDHAKTVDLIHLATHGVANSKDPLDKSYLVLSDSLWTARQISKFRQSEKAEPVFKNHPLIVMSACQTALGKDFSVGTIGLARAWHWVGASNVVMSLWSVDDCATQKLMTDFIRLKANKPTDKALQEAMQLSRESDDNPANWASFGIFGKPELLIRD
jgi:CHAT domain-containing protein